MKETIEDWYKQDGEEEKADAPKKNKTPIGRDTLIIAGAIILGSLIISTGILCGS